jgi:protein-tyrosine-phosphatase
MAEYLARQWFASNGIEKYTVISRGLTDQYEPPGSPASNNGIIVMKEDFGIDMSTHRSALLTQSEVDEAGAIICVSRRHAEIITHNFSNATDKLHVLKKDVSDPWHAQIEVYRACAHQLAALIPAQFAELFSYSANT